MQNGIKEDKVNSPVLVVALKKAGCKKKKEREGKVQFTASSQQPWSSLLPAS